MAEAYKKIDQREVPAAQTLIYTVPALTEAIVKHIKAVSTDAGDKWVKLWHTDGAAPVDANLILPQTDISAGGMGEWEGTLLMEAGDRLYAEAETATSISLTVYGLELS